MIHTFRIISDLKVEHVQYLKDNHGIEAHEVCAVMAATFNGIELIVTHQPNNGTLLASIFVDVPVMLDRGEFTDADYLSVEKNLENVFGFIFGDKSLFHKHRLMRLDYRYDVSIEKKEHRHAYIQLFEKSLRKKGHRQRKLGRFNVTGEYVEYGTTVEHRNNSIQSVVYDKVAERIAKGKKVESYEENILRFEVRLETDQLYYQTNKTGLVRSLDNYFSESSYYYYMKVYILETYLTQDFHSFGKAIELVNESNLTLRRKGSLEDFIRKVSRGDLSTPQKVMASSTFRNKLEDCKYIGVHPITISSRWKHVPEIFVNPLSSLSIEVNDYFKLKG